jgi:hypothetical protein
MTPENPIASLYKQLPLPQQRAVNLIKLFIKVYNSKDGTGLFSGMARYQFLEERMKVAAIQSQTLLDFWSNLRQKLACPIASKSTDAELLEVWLLASTEQHETLHALATRAAELILIARSLLEHAKVTSDDSSLSPTPVFDDPLPLL